MFQQALVLLFSYFTFDARASELHEYSIKKVGITVNYCKYLSFGNDQVHFTFFLFLNVNFTGAKVKPPVNGVNT